MPRHVQPKSLYKVALMETVQIINSSCHSIEQKFGNYSEENCREQLKLVQKYLLQRIPGLVLDEVFNELRDVEPCIDSRIVFSVYMHKDIKRIDRAINAINKQSNAKPNDQFWILSLPRLHKLVHLNLKLNCTDSILQAVGESCPHLEYIDIVSKMTPDNRIGNALKIKFFVSDQGLRYLTNCTALKTIEMNTVFRRNFGGRLTVSGVRLLLKSLPNLTSISFHYMGEVLAQDMEDVGSLALVSLCDYNAQPHHMEAISRLCPNLNKLVLHCSKHDSNPVENVGNNTLKALANSSLCIVTLRLEKFCFGEEMRNLLKMKGCYVQSLILNIQTLLTTQDVELIGKTCPNINTFHLLGIKELTNNSTRTDSSSCLFGRLEVLAIVGQDWKEDFVLQLCLSNALSVRTICLYKSGIPSKDGQSLNEILDEIRQKNPMKNLRNLCLCTTAPITIETIEYFYNNCLDLTAFLTDCPGMSINKDFIKLQKKIRETNLDLDLECTSTEP